MNLSINSGGVRGFRTKAKIKLSALAEQCEIEISILKQVERGFLSLENSLAEKLSEIFKISSNTIIESQKSFVARVIPGEGYTSSKVGSMGITYPTVELDPHDGRMKVLDIFCGAGGLSFGFEQTGKFVTVAGIDLLQDRIDTFTRNHPHAIGIAGDIKKITPEDIQALIGKIDVLAGGPPCQGFSSIRPFRNLTENDPRNNLVEQYMLILAQLKPNWFVFENVIGLLTHESGSKLDIILKEFSELGYVVEWRAMNAANFGVPQSRERIVIVGNRIGRKFEWPVPTHHFEYKSMAGNRSEIIRSKKDLFDQNELQPAVTLMEAIGNLPPLEAGEASNDYLKYSTSLYQTTIRNNASSLTWHRATRHSEKMLNIIKHAGSSIHDLPPGMVTSGFSSCYSRLDANRPSNTITVNFVHPSSNRCIHPYQNRALTPREGARLQSFPDTFVFAGSTAQTVKQIGNAVPPLLGQVLAEAISNQN